MSSYMVQALNQLDVGSSSVEKLQQRHHRIPTLREWVVPPTAVPEAGLLK